MDTFVNVATFSACCAECNATFSYPDPGDFAYGAFIFTGERGTAFAYFQATGQAVFDLVDRVLAGSTHARLRTSDPTVVVRICARLADPIATQPLVAHHVCPACQSASWSWWQRDRTASADIAHASFSAFLSRSESEQREQILRMVDGVVPAPC